MESDERERRREARNVGKVPATLGLMIGGFLVVAAIAVIILWAL